MSRAGNETRSEQPVGLVGLGTVGCGWVAAYIARGFEVRAVDPSSGAEEKCHAFLRAAWPSLQKLGLSDAETPPLELLSVATDLGRGVGSCRLVHENAPEQLDLKQRLIGDIEVVVGDDVVIASSTGGIPPSPLSAKMRRPQRFVVMHPFNPPHLVPLVEVVGGAATDASVVDWSMTWLRALGKHPIRIDREAPGFLTNRLQFALLREAIHCLSEGIADAQSIEDAMTYGLAPRWAVMGALTTLTLSGGQDGMPAVLERFGPAFETWWAALGSPSLTPEVRSKLIDGAREITQGRSLGEWAAWRDEKLVDILTLAASRK